MKKKITTIIAFALAGSMLLTACSNTSTKKDRDDDDDDGDSWIANVTASQSEEPAESTTSTSASQTQAAYTGPEFSTTDIYGSSYTADYFRSHELTIVNVWGTYCGPCIDEMPELEELYNGELAELNVGLVAIPVDVYDSSTIDTCIDLVEDLGVTFPVLVPDDALYDEYIANTMVVPTTYIVDSTGTVVAGPIEGSYVDEYMEAVYANLG